MQHPHFFFSLVWVCILMGMKLLRHTLQSTMKQRLVCAKCSEYFTFSVFSPAFSFQYRSIDVMRERERESAWKKCKLYTIRSKIQNDFDGDAGIRICIPLSALLHSMKRWKLLEYWKHMEKEINREIVERVMECWFDLLVIQMNVISM